MNRQPSYSSSEFPGKVNQQQRTSEMALITPPIGFNLFLVQGMTGRDIGFISRAAAPMFGLMLLAVMLLIAFPEIALWLPEAMARKN